MSSSDDRPSKKSAGRKVTTHRLQEMKESGERITALTAYDYLMAQRLDQAGVDVVLVGDSVGTVVQGRASTVAVKLDTMVYHAAIVSRATRRALVVGDLPFMSYQVNSDDALRNAGRMVQEGGVEAVKLEGGETVAPTVRRIVDAGIPVMGHLGLTPQSIHKFGTYQVRATDPEEADEVRRGAVALQEAGAFAVVIEKVPAELAGAITKELDIPVVGIGAGPNCDGQILVSHDMLGIYTRFRPRFVRRYAELGDAMGKAFEAYCADVRSGEFPNADESY